MNATFDSQPLPSRKGNREGRIRIGTEEHKDLFCRMLLDICLAENARRLARYDSRLLRPEFMPRMVRAVRPLVGRGPMN